MAEDRISRLAAALVLAGALATIVAFLVFQYALGYQPCPLCLYQRAPWYAAAPLSALAVFLPGAELRRTLLWALAALMVVSAGLGVWHAGVEWKFWAGPAGCSGSGSASDAASLLNQLQAIRVVSCTDAAWRLFGLSMAGWNVVVSLGLAAIAAFGARRRRPL